MGAVTGLLGLGGGEGGTSVNFEQGYSPQQMQESYRGTQQALNQQQDLVRALQQQGGLSNQSQIYGQLQDVVAGRGPNPAQAMLAQATGQNVAQQAALMAGQRGAGANVGLMARQAGRAGADLQQQAAQQAATMQAQQSLGALGQAQNLATQQAAQQIQGTQAMTQAQMNQQQVIGNYLAALNQAKAGIAEQQAAGQQKGIGGVLGGIGKGLVAAGGPWSTIGGILGGAEGGEVPDVVTSNPQESESSPLHDYMRGFAQGGAVQNMKTGGHVPGKAKHHGDSVKNDTVHAMLSPGEIVIPRSIAQGKNAPDKSAQFVAAVLAKKGILS